MQSVFCNFSILIPPRDETQLKKETVKYNFAERVVKDLLFQKQRCLNELFDLEQTYNIHENMTPQQILMWANSLLKPFSLQIRAGEKTYQLEIQNDLMRLIARTNKYGRIYNDSRNLLNQQVRQKEAEVEDLFIEDETQAKRANKQFNTEHLDTGTQIMSRQLISA